MPAAGEAVADPELEAVVHRDAAWRVDEMDDVLPRDMAQNANGNGLLRRAFNGQTPVVGRPEDLQPDQPVAVVVVEEMEMADAELVEPPGHRDVAPRVDGHVPGLRAVVLADETVGELLGERVAGNGHAPAAPAS